MKKSEVQILLVDDNNQLRAVMQRTLAREGYQITEALDGRQAQQLLEDGYTFHLVVSDIRMPNLSGIDLLYYVKNTYEIPVILITAFSELLEMRDAYEIGAAGFLSKPFKGEELLSTIESVLNIKPSRSPTPAAPDASLDNDFFEIDIEEFADGKVTETDLYFKLSPQKYVKVASQGTDLDSERVRSYMQKGVKQLYFKRAG